MNMEIKPVAFLVVMLIVITVGVVTIREVAKNAEALDIEVVSGSENFILLGSKSLAQSPLTSFSATGKNQTWLDFDGVNDEVMKSWTKTVDINRSISAWIKLGENSHSANNKIIFTDKCSIDSGTTGLWLGNITVAGQAPILNSTPCYAYYNSSSSGTMFKVCLTAEIPEGEWHNIAGTMNGTDISIFLDGVLNNSLPTNSDKPPYGNTGNFNMAGCDTYSGIDYYNGSIDEVRVYNRTLIDSDMLNIYNSGRQPNYSLPSAGLIMWLPLNENNGTDVTSLV